ncbi:MAG: outer membrane beta-barrel protein [Ignavibacteria bacterium]|jgi:hypothetical protein|nr:outer membrane beta-barrel protein [Ignavibacteria bacterium]
MNKVFYLLLFAILTIPGLIYSQSYNQVNNGKINLKGKHSINLNLGIIDNTSEVTVDINNVSTDMNFQASMSYNYWFTDELAVEANFGYMSSSVNSNVSFSGVEQKTSVITPYYLGGKYSPCVLSIAENIRPFAFLLLGGVSGSGTEETVNYTNVSTTSFTYTVFSFKSGIGADALINRYIKLGLFFDYLYMPDFEKPVGTRNNYSGINLSFSFGVML